MTARLVRLALLSLLAAAGTLSPTSAAHAADNSRDSLYWAPGDDVVAVCDDGSRIGLGFDLVRNIHVHTDREGEVLREVRNVTYTGIFENLGSGERYMFQGTRVVTLDFERRPLHQPRQLPHGHHAGVRDDPARDWDVRGGPRCRGALPPPGRPVLRPTSGTWAGTRRSARCSTWVPEVLGLVGDVAGARPQGSRARDGLCHT